MTSATFTSEGSIIERKFFKQDLQFWILSGRVVKTGWVAQHHGKMVFYIQGVVWDVFLLWRQAYMTLQNSFYSMILFFDFILV